MEYLDQSEFERRVWRLQYVIRYGLADMDQLAEGERAHIERYYLAATSACDMARHRCAQLKQLPNLELLANRAYEKLMARLGMSFTLPDETSV